MSHLNFCFLVTFTTQPIQPLEGLEIEFDEHLYSSFAVNQSARDCIRGRIQPLPTIVSAISIEIEPLTISDWELLEIHADELESGNLLGQVSVVYPNQILPIPFLLLRLS